MPNHKKLEMSEDLTINPAIVLSGEKDKLSHIMRTPVFAICDNEGADQSVHPRSLI